MEPKRLDQTRYTEAFFRSSECQGTARMMLSENSESLRRETFSHTHIEQRQSDPLLPSLPWPYELASAVSCPLPDLLCPRARLLFFL